MARASDWSPVDLDRDPTPGNPDEVRELADSLQTFADDVGEALGRIRGMAEDRAVLDWAGLSAEAFRSEFDGVPGNLEKLQTSYDMAAQALQTYWPKLETAQGMADRALDRAIAAQADLSSAQAALSDAQDWVSRAGEEADRLEREGERDDVEPPSEAEVRAATRDANAADQAASSAQSRVDSAEEALAAARQLALDAKELREEAAQVCADGIDAASDAGIQNRRWWEDAIHWVSENWDTIVEICKVVVAVLGIVVMIIGGPLAWVVLAAALVVLADTLYRYANGEASLWDVAFAALDCIPGMKGLTTLGGLARGMRSLATTSLRGLRQGLRGLGQTLRRTGRQGEALFCRTDPIDMATGEVVMDAVDVELPGVLPLVVRRHHRSSLREGTWFGPSWASTLDQRLVLDPAGVQFVTADGMILDYPRPDPEAPVLPVEGPRWELGWNGEPGTPLTVYQRDAGLTLHFEPVPGRRGGELPLSAVTDLNGNRITVVYGADGAPSELRHHGGYRLGLSVSAGRVVEIRLLSDPDEPTLVRYAYDEAGDLSEVHNSSGLPLLLRYDAHHRVTGWVDRNETWYAYHYDEQGRCVGTTGTDGVLASRVAYDAETHRTVFTDSLGHSTVYEFNDCYQLVTETDPLGHRTHREWDRYDRLLSLSDPLGRVTRFEYDQFGNRVAHVAPDGGRTEVAFNDLGLWTVATDADGATWSREYDERGNLLQITDPAGAVERFDRDARGALTRHVDPVGRVRVFENDAAGLPTRVTDRSGLDVRYERDGFGRVTLVDQAGAASTRLTWSVEGKLVARAVADGPSERWRYDAEGNLVEHVDPAGRRTRHTVGVFDKPVETELPGGARWRHVYDTELRLTSVRNPDGLTWTYDYDAKGRLVAETDFSGRRVGYAYDAAGQRVSQTNGAGQTVHRRYSARGDLVEETTGGSTTIFTYTAAGLMTTAVNPDATLSFRHDAAGRVIEEISDGRATVFGYDAAGRPVYRRTPSGVESRWEWAEHQGPAALHTASRTLRFDYADGRQASRQLPGDARIDQRWDQLGQLTEQRIVGPEHAPIGRAYAYGPDGGLRALIRLDGLSKQGPRHLERDPEGRITALHGGEPGDEHYSYDATGNVVATGDGPERVEHVIDGVRLRRAGRTSYEHDAQGRVTRKLLRLLSGGTREWRYVWDGADRLTDLIIPDGSHWHYRYDPLGRRVAKQRLAEDGTVLEETRFVWDGSRMAEQTHTQADSPDRCTTTWEWEPGTHRPLAQFEHRSLRDAPQDEIDQRFYSIVTDLVGTPTELIDEEGTIAWRNDTKLWGWSSSTTRDDDANSAPNCPLRFPGQYHDAESHLHYNLFRYYDPATGWYWSPDALGLFAANHPYRYVDDPLLLSDPLGLAPCLATQLANRAGEFHSALPPGSQGYQTVAVIRVRTPHGEVDLVSGSGTGLRPPQPSMVDRTRVPPELEVPNSQGFHAEQNILVFANAQGWTPIAGGASRPVCSDICAPLIRAAGGRISGEVIPGTHGTQIRTFEW
ncbi:hypothetical protein E1265_18275 [Streptomyces sp. 8K308]|uniref:DUF6531 domain-containing protein n=1 Tax=Streptomyces sp. 8K308 TaxID=2530388 RepID=UPI0010526DD0|nr:DUF6531 domain-containing protein [Streptomyces sp. 8K308]TDC21342.1 hypothetical protein E1265_18275 [Streptomyces sp. 8K308]